MTDLTPLEQSLLESVNSLASSWEERENRLTSQIKTLTERLNEQDAAIRDLSEQVKAYAEQRTEFEKQESGLASSWNQLRDTVSRLSK